MPGDLADKVLCVGGLPHDVDGALGEQAHQPLAKEDIVLADHDTHGISARILVPVPAGLSISRCPSSAPTRSARPRSPVPAASFAPPTPSSETSTSMRSFSRATRKRA